MIDSEKISNNQILKLNETLGELFTPEEIAKYLKVHPVTVYNWVKENKIDCFILTEGKRKSTVRFNKEHIQQFIQARNSGQQ